VAFYEVNNVVNNSPTKEGTFNLVFQGPTQSVTLTAGERVTATLTLTAFGVTTTNLLGYGICYEPSGGTTPMQFGPSLNYDQPPANSDFSLTAADSVVFPTAGTYTIGWCGVFYSGWPATFSQVGVVGWVEVTAN
jgi:hypothetical protein